MQRLRDPLALDALFERYPRRPGVPALRALLGQRVTLTRSELEKRFGEFLADAGLPLPETNAHLQISGIWYEVDCLWRAERVVVELDGRATHHTRAAFEADRARDRALQAAGFRVVRITWRQLHESPAAVAADLRALLRLGGTTAD